MITLEIDNDTFLEIKDLAKDFIDNALKNVRYQAERPWDLETIGLRMVEVLYPKEYKKYYRKLCNTIRDEIAKEDSNADK